MPKRSNEPDRIEPVEPHGGRVAEIRQAESEGFRQHIDPSGVVRLDRKFTPEEAQAEDEEHQRRYLEARERRFFGPSEWREIYGDAYDEAE